ncbi:NAD(P)H-hydrate dehydratase [Rhizobium sp. SSA_523]|uniref:NAD(P)H-hydrate dehydratase n=1 Tax=Rhizobium sp. SSA_523 TaxID=2952477 RepID=UPI002090C315|nr:NAD(P)H-hydrate dehydratase [Rhizobium sp. SSA_523]MCO5733753.1 NAD(P)H-hydrate dehydratase [Rhizobium sp. SSA_523]WKC24973.1 NAD(P)H-hydrate dehydratase [Rhizobium sp. SSA_523]
MSAHAKILLTPSEMASVDAAAAASGLSSFGLMEQAGFAVAAAALRHCPGASRYILLCGPGKNGGDGFVAARALAQSGAVTAVHALSASGGWSGDAELARLACPCPCLPLDDYQPRPGDLVIDALFGAGLSRDVPPAVAAAIERVEAAGLPVLSVDLPSGVCGLTGQVRGKAFAAARSVTFMTRKPGHVLMPGRALSGVVDVADIGIPDRFLHSHAGALRLNEPGIWLPLVPELTGAAHKYRRGHLVVFSGPASHTGAARLSAAAGLDAGAGLVTIAAPQDSLAVLAPALTAIMLRQIDDEKALSDWLSDATIHAFVIGPGFGIGEKARRLTEAASGKPVVVDADAITAFATCPQRLYAAFADTDSPKLVLTPHEGEFSRLFPDIADAADTGKVEKARSAAARAGAIIVYKGADTVIAAPDGRVLINENAPPFLATAGSGDVLAGMIGALLAQGMPSFEAAAAAVWLHGEAGQAAGPSLTAETLVPHIAAARAKLAAIQAGERGDLPRPTAGTVVARPF